MNGKNGAGHPAPGGPGERPEHPGFIILREYLQAQNLTQRKAAERLGLSLRTVSELVRCTRDVSERTGIRLEGEGVRTAVEWLTLQARYNDWRRRHLDGPGNAAPG